MLVAGIANSLRLDTWRKRQFVCWADVTEGSSAIPTYILQGESEIRWVTEEQGIKMHGMEEARYDRCSTSNKILAEYVLYAAQYLTKQPVYKKVYSLVLRSKWREAFPQSSHEQIIHKLFIFRIYTSFIFTFRWASSKISLQLPKHTPNKAGNDLAVGLATSQTLGNCWAWTRSIISNTWCA